MITTIEEVYAAVNPMPAMLSAKGKVKPRVTIEFEANARVIIWLRWNVDYKPRYCGEEELKPAYGDTADEAVAEALSIINNLPSVKEAKLHAFMADLGRVIDAGREQGIDVEYLNPLTETMKRLSENIITYQPARRSAVRKSEARA
jgi:hypothetical protein